MRASSSRATCCRPTCSGVSIFDARDAIVPLPSGTDLQFGRARRRDQPRAAQDAERADGGDGGASGLAGRRDAQAARPVLRDRDAESGRADRRLSAARVAARPLPDGHRARLPGPGRRARAPDERRPARAGGRRSPPLADPPTLLEWQREAAAVHVAPALLDYVQALLAATRGNVGSGADAGARRGLSPRAGLMLLAAARAWAMLSGRPMVLPEDVQAVFPSVAGHRLAGGARAGAAAGAGAAARRRAALTAGRATPRRAATAPTPAFRRTDPPSDARVHPRVRARAAPGSWRADISSGSSATRRPTTTRSSLRHSRIYILPTKRGLALLATLVDHAAHLAQLLRCRSASS